VTNSNISANSNTEINVKSLKPPTGRLKYTITLIIMMIIIIIIIIIMVIMIVIVIVVNTVAGKLLGISYSHNFWF
jgi:heme/copper-type cytochrome/quinol oxidase subunit 2